LPSKELAKEGFIHSFKEYYVHFLWRDEDSHQAYEALGLTIRDCLLERRKETLRTYKQ